MCPSLTMLGQIYYSITCIWVLHASGRRMISVLLVDLIQAVQISVVYHRLNRQGIVYDVYFHAYTDGSTSTKKQATCFNHHTQMLKIQV